MSGLSNHSLLSALALLLTTGALSAQTPQLDYKPLKAYSYKYAMRGEVSLSATTREAAEKRSFLAQDCDIAVDLRLVRKQSDGSALIELRISDVQAVDSENNATRLDATTRRNINRPIFFEHRADGTIGQIYRHKSESPKITNFKRTIISEFQTQLEAAAEGLRGEVQKVEKNAMGEFHPRYSMHVSRSGGDYVITKRWDETSFSTHKRSSQFEALRQGGGSLRGEQTTTINKEEGVIGKTDVAVSLDPAQGTREELTIQTQTRAGLRGGLELRMVRPTFGSPSFDAKQHIATSLDMDEYDVFDPNMSKYYKDPQNFLQAVRLLRVDMQAADKIGALIKSTRMDERLKLELVSALAQGGSKYSQTALVRDVLKNANASSSMTERALKGLMHNPSPRAETVDEVAKLLEHSDTNIRRLSLTAMGSMIGKLARKDKEGKAIAARHLETLHAYTSQPLSTSELQVGIAALGNAGVTESIERIATFAHHSDLVIRREAVDALRKFDNDRVLGLLTQLASEDKEVAVRMKAIQVLGERVPVNIRQDPAKLVDKKWNHNFGWAGFSTQMNGYIKSTRGPEHTEAVNEINVKAWGIKQHIGRIESASDANERRESENQFSAYVLGQKIFGPERSVRDPKCTYNYDETWDTGPMDVLQLSESFPIYGGINIALSANMTFQFAANFKGDFDYCDTNNINMAFGLTPMMNMNAAGTIGLDILGFAIGGGLELAVSNLSLPNWATINITNGGQTWSGSTKVDFTMDGGYFNLKATVIGKDFELYREDFPSVTKNLVDKTWP